MSITSVPPLESLAWTNIQVELISPDAPVETLSIADCYPFTSVNDFKRQLWMAKKGSHLWAPENVYLTTADDGRSIEFYWPFGILPDPVVNRIPREEVTDALGNRKPISATMVGGITLEAAIGSTPRLLRAVCLAALQPTTDEPPTAQEFVGFYQVYFPWLSSTEQIRAAAGATASKAQRDAYAAAVLYTEDRLGRISVIQRALAARLGGIRPLQMTTVVQMRWYLNKPAVKPSSLEEVFYSMPTSSDLPFLRYHPVQGSPILKLAINPDGSQIIKDFSTVATWLATPVPKAQSALIVGRIPIKTASSASAFVLYMFADGSVDITLEVGIKGQVWPASVAVDAQRTLQTVLQGVGFSLASQAQLRDLQATYRWLHPAGQKATPLTPARLQKRIEALSPFFDPSAVITAAGTLGTYRWRAVSNYESESAQFTWLTQTVLMADAGGQQILEEGAAGLNQLATGFAKQFGVSPEAALSVINSWMERRAEAVAPAATLDAGSEAVPRHNTGTLVTIGGTHPEYTISVQEVESYTDLQRILSVVSVALGAPSADLAPPPTAVMAAVQSVVAVADTVLEDAVVADAAAAAAAAVTEASAEAPVMEDVDPDMAALLGDLGFGLDTVPAEELVEETLPTLTVTNLPAGLPPPSPAPPPAGGPRPPPPLPGLPGLLWPPPCLI